MRFNSAVLGVLPLLAPIARAQTVTNPVLPGVTLYENLAAGSFGESLGAYADQRAQLLNGDLAGKTTAASFKRMQFRRETTLGYPNTSRSWKAIDVKLAQHDFAKRSTVFTANFLSSPTRVFSGSMSWPGHTNLPPGQAAPTWAHFAKKDDMSITFTSPYLRTDKSGLCVDYTFHGGKLANGIQWAAPINFGSPYYMDGVFSDNPATTYWNAALLGGTKCRATGATIPSILYPFGQTYPPSGTDKGRFRLWFVGSGMPASSSIFTVLSSGGSTWYDPGTGTWPSNGIPYPGSCNPLYLNLSSPHLVIGMTTSSAGKISSAGNSLRGTFDPALVGARLWAQAGFTDPGPGPSAGFQLTRAGRIVLGNVPSKTQCAFVYRFGATSKSGQMQTTKVNLVRLVQ